MNFDQFLKFAYSHKSVRNFKSDSISPDSLNKIFEAGLRSSSAGNMQSWSVVTTSSITQKERLFKAHREQKMILEAPIVLTFCSDFNRNRRWIELAGKGDPQSFDDLLGFLTGMMDASLAAQNMALASEAMGLGICYMGTTLWAMEEIGEILSLPKYVVPVTSMVIGYPSETHNKDNLIMRLPLELMIHQESYNSAMTDENFLSHFEEREKSYAERYAQDFRLSLLRKKHEVKSVAGMMTAPFKYSKELHVDSSEKIIAFLKKQGFWNHQIKD